MALAINMTRPRITSHGVRTIHLATPTYLPRSVGCMLFNNSKKIVVFCFFLGVGRVGLGLFVVRFWGLWVIYELGIQEALAHYAGANQYASSTAYLDFLLGFTPMELVPGYDCPDHTTFSDNRTNRQNKKPKDNPKQRHDAAFISVTKNI